MALRMEVSHVHYCVQFPIHNDTDLHFTFQLQTISFLNKFNSIPTPVNATYVEALYPTCVLVLKKRYEIMFHFIVQFDELSAV